MTKGTQQAFPTFDQLFRAADGEARDLLLAAGVDPLASGAEPSLFQEALDRITEHTQAYFEGSPEEAEEDQLARDRGAREYAAYFIGLAIGCRVNVAPFRPAKGGD